MNTVNNKLYGNNDVDSWRVSYCEMRRCAYYFEKEAEEASKILRDTNSTTKNKIQDVKEIILSCQKQVESIGWCHYEYGRARVYGVYIDVSVEDEAKDVTFPARIVEDFAHAFDLCTSATNFVNKISKEVSK